MTLQELVDAALKLETDLPGVASTYLIGQSVLGQPLQVLRYTCRPGVVVPGGVMVPGGVVVPGNVMVPGGVVIPDNVPG